MKLENLLLVVYQNLKLTEQHLAGLLNKNCTYCGVNVEYLKKHALLALQTANFTPFVTKSMMTMNQNDVYSETSVTPIPTATHGETSDAVNGRRVQGLNNTNDLSREMTPSKDNFGRASHTANNGPVTTPTPAQFFAEAAKKFNIPSKRKSKKTSKNKIEDTRLFPTDFSSLIKNSPPPNPPGLFKYMGRRVDGKVSVMLRISQSKDVEQSDSLLEVDQRRKQVSIQQPKNTSFIPPKLQSANNAVPKLFGFDAIFEAEMLPSRVSSSSLLDVLHAVVNGGEGCLLVYGAAGVGKSSTMVGRDESNRTLGVIPAAIAWLYSLIEDCKQRTGARISVRVSAVEVIGQNEQLKDLLSEQAAGGDSTDSTGASPGIYLREDPIGGTVQLGNVSEPQAVSAEKAAFYLDAALAARTTDKEQNSHMIFTVHVYQYRVEKNQRRGPGGAVPYSGGRSRLHLIDLSCFNSNFDQMQNGAAPSHAGLGQIIVAMLNGFKQVPYKDSKITRLLKDSIGNPTCRTTLVAHVSAEEKNYAKTFSTLQTVSKIQRSRRKRNKYCSSSSDNTSCDESRGRRRPNPAIVKTYGIDDSNMSSDYTSSAGEDSCDTVIYMGNNGRMSDRDLSDNERPPSPKTFKAMQLKLTSSSEDESQSENSNQIFNTNTSCCTNINEKTKVKGIEKSQKCDSVTDPSTDNTNREKHINIVPPLVITAKSVCESNVTTSLSPSTESEKSKTSLVEQIIENGNSKETVLIPKLDNSEMEQNKAPSEKELRRREKRIAKLLKETMSDDEVPALVSFNNKKNNKNILGYTSDNDVGSIRRKHDKQDGYISAPENHRCKPVQAVKGVVRQRSVESRDPTKFDMNKNRELLKNWVQNELMKHLQQMESMKSSLECMSNALPETILPDIDNDIVEKCDDKNVIKSSIDNFRTPIDLLDVCTSKFTAPYDDVGTSVDGTDGSLSLNTNELIFSLDTIGTPVDPPCIESISSNSKDIDLLPNVELTENTSIEHVHIDPSTKKIDESGNTTTFGIEPPIYASDGPSAVVTDDAPNANNLLEDNDNNNNNNNSCSSNDFSFESDTSSPKIENLNHVITISAIPNFTVTTKEPTLNQLISSPQVQRNSTRTANIANTRYYKGSITSVDQEWNRPVFERSYSKEDTCSLVSVNESDAYDSDHYCSSYTSYNPSPAVERKQHKRPTRLKYRWSTVFEEEENKKEKTSKNIGNGKSKNQYIDDNDLKNISCVTPKSRSSKSPKKEKDRRTRSVDSCPLTPTTSSKCSDPSPKGHKKFQLLSPRSDRRMKDSSSENKRNSGCSDASSGIGSSSSQSQSSSLHSNEDILTDEIIVEKETPVKSKYWPFSRTKSRKYRPSGYMSDGHITDSHARSRRHSRLFGSRSKSMVYNDGHSSGYDTSITEGGMTSCNEDLTDTEGGRSKKKKRFLGFRRRSTNDLNTSRGRYKKPIWLDGRRCQSDDEDVRIKVYNIDEPRRLDRQICKSENTVSPRFQLRRIEELKKERGVLKSSSDLRSRSSSKIEDQYSIHGEKENSAIGRKLKTLKNHIQVVTCFDAHQSIDRKVTRI